MLSMTKTNEKINIVSTIRDARTKSTNNILHFLIIKDKNSYKNALSVMEYLMLNAPDTANNPYHDFMILLGEAIETYEKKHHPIAPISGKDVLKFLIEQKGLRQIDLAPILGTASIVCEILSGKRQLNKRQIEALSKYFKVSPEVFFIYSK
jgi:HTH-type transcriptional regulator/antitoxin HigA